MLHGRGSRNHREIALRLRYGGGTFVFCRNCSPIAFSDVHMSRTASEVRAKFEEVSRDGQSLRVRCMHNACAQILTLPIKDASSTTSLRRHLVQYHGLDEYSSQQDVLNARRNAQEDEDTKRQRVENWSRFGVKVQHNSQSTVFQKLSKADKRLLTNLAASLDIVSNMRPLSALKDKGRRLLARVSGCPLPSPVTARAMIQEWFKDLLNYVKEDLARAEVESIAITADGWTNFAGEHFTTFTLHYIDRAFKSLRAVCIGCLHQRDDRISAEVLARDLDAVLTKIGWDRDKPLAAATTDEGSNFRKLVTESLNTESGRQILDPRVICVDHMIKTSFEHSLDRAQSIKAIFDAAEKLSSICRKSRAIKVFLQGQQAALHASEPDRPKRCTPVLPVITRWGSHYDCILRLVALKDALNGVIARLVGEHGQVRAATVHGSKYKPFIDAMQAIEPHWEAISALVVVLTPFRSVIILAQGEYYSTLAPTWANLITALDILESNDADTQEMSSFKAAFLDELQSRFANPDKIPTSALLSVALDPRFKNRNVFHRYPLLAGAQNQALLAAVQSMIEAAHAAQPNRQPRAGPEPPAPGVVHALNNFDPAHMNMMQCQRAGMQASQLLVNQIPVLPPSEAPLPRPETFITSYRAAQGLPVISTQSEVLQWFQRMSAEMSHSMMLDLARQFVFIPATSAPSERVASTAGQIYNKRRLRLHESLAECIIVLHESQRIVARRILAMCPANARWFVERALQAENLLSPDGSDADNQVEGESADDESVNSLGSSDRD